MPQKQKERSQALIINLFAVHGLFLGGIVFAVVNSLHVPKVVKCTLCLIRIIPHILDFCNIFSDFSVKYLFTFKELLYWVWYLNIKRLKRK